MVAILIAFVNKIYRFLALTLRKQIDVLVLVACGDELLQTEKFEVVGKIGEEIADARVITIAQHGLAAEMLAEMPQLVVDVFKLSVKLILFCLLRLIQILVGHIFGVNVETGLFLSIYPKQSQTIAQEQSSFAKIAITFETIATGQKYFLPAQPY